MNDVIIVHYSAIEYGFIAKCNIYCMQTHVQNGFILLCTIYCIFYCQDDRVAYYSLEVCIGCCYIFIGIYASQHQYTVLQVRTDCWNVLLGCHMKIEQGLRIHPMLTQLSAYK